MGRGSPAAPPVELAGPFRFVPPFMALADADPSWTLAVEGGVVPAEGGTDADCTARAAVAGAAAVAWWPLTRPRPVEAVHVTAIGAGARLIRTHTRWANAAWLPDATAAQVQDLNLWAAKLARSAREVAGEPCLVAGYLAPLPPATAPVAARDPAAVVGFYRNQVAGLLAGGVDLFWIAARTPVEAQGALLAVREAARLPVGLVWEPGGGTGPDGAGAEAAQILAALQATGVPDALGVAVAGGPEEAVRWLGALRSAGWAGPLWVSLGHPGTSPPGAARGPTPADGGDGTGDGRPARPTGGRGAGSPALEETADPWAALRLLGAGWVAGTGAWSPGRFAVLARQVRGDGDTAPRSAGRDSDGWWPDASPLAVRATGAASVPRGPAEPCGPGDPANRGGSPGAPAGTVGAPGAPAGPAVPADPAGIAGGLAPAAVAIRGGVHGTASPAPETGAADGVPPSPGQGRSGQPVPLRERLGRRFVISVELDPPRGPVTTKFVADARTVAAAGADAVNVGDSPMARPRMAALAGAYLVRSAAGIDAIMHCTTRDRNLMALQADLLAAHALGVRNVLALTGDHPRLGTSRASAVYDVDSIGLLEVLAALRRGEDPQGNPLGAPVDFTVACALSPNADDLDRELERFRRKLAVGVVDFVMTQPLYEIAPLERVLDRLGGCPVPILMGVMPLHSGRHAHYLHHQVPGITIPAAVREALDKAGDRGLEVGLELAEAVVEAARSYIAGVYVVVSYGKAEPVAEFVRRLRTRFDEPRAGGPERAGATGPRPAPAASAGSPAPDGGSRATDGGTAAPAASGAVPAAQHGEVRHHAG
ncbi:MAG TPA: methylenetetrahydrofolate reductase [Thermaerobacter sp.]